MKIVTIFLLSLFATSVFAKRPSFPVGYFQYTNSKATQTKHIKIFYTRSPKEKNAMLEYKELGYTCKLKANRVSQCQKIITTDPNRFEFKTDKLISVSPALEELEEYNISSESDAVTVYEVKQVSTSNQLTSNQYKAYDIVDSGFYIDLPIDKFNKARFAVLSPRVLSRLTQEKEKISKKEYYIHNLMSYYIK